MGKYEPLTKFLSDQPVDEIRMSFNEIERVIGDRLPASARNHRAWWSNNPNNSVMTKAWLDAGFRSEQVDMGGRKVVFRRSGVAAHAERKRERGQHPLIGCMKDVTWIAPGTDLTQPAMPEWGEMAYGDKDPE